MKKSKKIPSIALISALIFFLYLPLVIMAIFSFNDSTSLSVWEGFSFCWYADLIDNSSMIDAIKVSLSVGIIATFVSVVLGTMTAIGLSKNKKVVRSMLLQANNIPIMNPEIVTAVSLMIFFSFLGMEKGYTTLLLAHIAFCTPVVITNVYPKVKQLDPNLADAAMDLGASPFQALIKVIIPQIKPGIFTGALMSFTMSFDDFIISYFVTGNGVENISIVIYNMTKRTNPSVYALSTIVLVVVLCAVLIGTIVPMMVKKRRRLVRNEQNV
ncbi:ABC transporter permease [Tannockella kyphosi]|uniref:ABC transporter permease n=1 Tax=Tannockella kyphosi TaxID=2899121 RepID=UPI00201394F5|nr:ABC transporter permease [Tannockella kyphosi]